MQPLNIKMTEATITASSFRQFFESLKNFMTFSSRIVCQHLVTKFIRYPMQFYRSYSRNTSIITAKQCVSSACHGIDEDGEFFRRTGRLVAMLDGSFFAQKPICKRSPVVSNISYLRFGFFSAHTSKTSAVLLRRRFLSPFSWYPCNAIQEKVENGGIWGGIMPI